MMFAFTISYVSSIVFFGLNLIAVVKVIFFDIFESFQLRFEKGEKK